MTDDSQKNDESDSSSGDQPSEFKLNEFEFNAADIPGLNLASDSPVSTDSAADLNAHVEMPSPTFDATALTSAIQSTDENAAAEKVATLSEAEASPEPSPENNPVTETPPIGEELVSTPAAADTIQKVKEFSEKMPMEKVQVPAAFPFSLLIDGELTPEEKEKLVDVISRESMGFREVDLEPQFANHRVLIPRISEYAGVLLVQALRGTRARMRLGPSESIFSAQDAEVSNDPLQPGMRLPEPEAPTAYGLDLDHPAERIAITPDSALPQLTDFDVIDTILATAVLTSHAVEAETSTEYTEILENLKRELKYKAHRKGAAGIIHFKTELQQLSLASQYRLTVSGAAVRARSSEPSPHASLETSKAPETSH